jgi:uncharacterized membrane protein YqjE
MPETSEQDMREQPMGALFRQLSSDLSMLVRQELQLAQVEITEKGKAAARGAGMLSGAGIAGLLALGAFTTFAIAALSTGMEVWIAALLTAAVYGALGGVLATTGRRRVMQASPPVPQQTVETVKEDAQWAKTQLSSGRR